MNVKECFEKGLLKKESPNIQKAKRSIEISQDKLSSAKRLLDIKEYEMTLIAAYSSMFHSSRALLFKDGIREKSHYGLYIYIKEKYQRKLGLRFVNELNTMRLERHDVFYGLEKTGIKEIEAENIAATAKEYLEKIEKLL